QNEKNGPARREDRFTPRNGFLAFLQNALLAHLARGSDWSFGSTGLAHILCGHAPRERPDLSFGEGHFARGRTGERDHGGGRTALGRASPSGLQIWLVCPTTKQRCPGSTGLR